MNDVTDDPSPVPTPRLQKSLSYLNWLYNPFHGLDVGEVYDLLSTTSPTERGLYINLGYWCGAKDFDEASEALAMLVAKTARIGINDTVLDCGFGFADQDLLWAEKLGPLRIIGLNITASQVTVARRRVVEMGRGECIDLRLGSATEMPIEANSIDAVVALECAFHFRTRELFFKEAWRVLRPGGRLVTADIIPMPPAQDALARAEQRVSWALVASKFRIPSENAYTQPSYRSKLESSGFAQIQVDSIRDQVYAPMHHFLAENPETLQRLHPMMRGPARFALRFEATSVYRGLDYVLATALKPHSDHSQGILKHGALPHR